MRHIHIYTGTEVVLGQKSLIWSNRLESFLLNKQYPTPPKYPLTVFETKGNRQGLFKVNGSLHPKISVYLFQKYLNKNFKLKLFGQPVLSAF